MGSRIGTTHDVGDRIDRTLRDSHQCLQGLVELSHIDFQLPIAVEVMLQFYESFRGTSNSVIPRKRQGGGSRQTRVVSTIITRQSTIFRYPGLLFVASTYA